MSRRGPGALAVVTIAIGVLLASGGLASNVRAQTAPDRSEVVIVLDFSASILQDAANRNKFGAALERIADRVDATTADLIAGDAVVTMVQFAARATDYAGCADMHLLASAPTVARFADCLRSIARAYRRGLDPALTRRIGVDTNYVAAMEQAAKHLPADAARPALILFTDGKHDVRGVPVSRVQVVRDQLFGSRSPFALLPVGMGLNPRELGALETGLARLRIVRAMPPCVSGTKFDWPDVVFESPDEAGNAVGVALQDVTCTFTVAPSPTPLPTPAPTPAVVQGIRLTPLDGQVQLTWAPPPSPPAPITDYRTRCRAGEGDWIESKEGVSLETTATVDGLTNGTAYHCEVATVSALSDAAWTPASSTITPLGIPAAPGKPSVQPMDGAVQISVTPVDPVLAAGYHFQCSSDQGSSWPAEVDVEENESATTQIGNLTNGVAYVCRAFAVNTTGLSDASPLSDAVRPCGSNLECNPVLPWILGGLAVVLAGSLIAVLFALNQNRTRGYVVAVVDVIHTVNLGHGSRLGIELVRAHGTRTVTGIAPDRGRKADIRIRQLRGNRFEVTDRSGRHVTTSGEPIVVTDSAGGRHDLVLWAFATRSASEVTSRR